MGDFGSHKPVITIKTTDEIKIMAEGGRILAKVMQELQKKVRPGISTNELDRLAESLIFQYGGSCSFKGYRGYPVCLCASINEQIVHAIPSDRILKEGDIISLDLGIKYKGYNADMAITVPVGKINPEVKNLLEVARGALEVGIAKAAVGNTFGDISNAIQKYIESRGFNAVRDLCGHGIGKELHEDPEILNYGKIGTGPELVEGMVFCLEPMVSAGDYHIKKSRDGFGYETQDGSLSAHFEHTIALIQSGPRTLTKI